MLRAVRVSWVVGAEDPVAVLEQGPETRGGRRTKGRKLRRAVLALEQGRADLGDAIRKELALETDAQISGYALVA